MEPVTPALVLPHRMNNLLHDRFPGLVEALDWAAAGIDLIAIVLILAGVLRFLADLFRHAGTTPGAVSGLDLARVELGRYILAGLELLIVSDIIHTALSLEITDLLYLGLLVLIRSAISYFLSREIREIREQGGS